jgi:hypothetical protein
MEILKKVWTKQEVIKHISDLTAQKAIMQDLGASTTEVDVLITQWTQRFQEME